MSYKSLLVKKYLEEYNGKLSKHALSKYLFEKYPMVFSSVENARGVIRYVTGSSGENNKYGGKVEWVNIEAEEDGIWEYIMPIGQSPLLCLFDIHLGYHCQKSLDKALNHGIKISPKGILLGGDTLDCYKLSKYEQDPSKRNFSEELDMLDIFLQDLKKNFNCPIYFKIGNHEDRYMRLIKANPQLMGIPTFDEAEVFKLTKNGVHLIKSMQKIVCGPFDIYHGHEFRGSAGVNPAKWLYERTGKSSTCGHFHRSDNFYADNGNKYHVSTTGCLSNLRPGFMPHQRFTMKHNNGFGELYFDKNHSEYINHRL